MKIEKNRNKTAGRCPAPSSLKAEGQRDRASLPTYAALTILILFFFLLLTTSGEAVENFNIKVGVAESQSSGKLLGNGLMLRDAKGTTLSAQNGAAVTAAGASVKVGGKTLALPVKVTAQNGLGWGLIKYRGTLTLIRAGSKFTVVNEVDIENYLRGILKIEMNPEWHQEALRAQAILARTYATRNRGRFAAKGFDLCATDQSQVYRGINGEDPRTDKAVTDTKGQILTHGGKPASIFYHSDSGGATADVSQVWGGAIPYLQCRPEVVEYQSPNSQWHVTIPPADLARILGKMGYNVGVVRNAEVVQRDASGRAVTLRFTGDRGTAKVKSHAFRMAAGSKVIRSTNFSIGGPHTRLSMATEAAPAVPPKEEAAPALAPVTTVKLVENLDDFPWTADPLVEMTKRDVFTKDELYDMIMNPEKRDEYLQTGLERLRASRATIQLEAAPVQPARPAPTPAPASSTTTRVIPAPAQGSPFLFVGAGWGHGVGMSQWGAKAMADQGTKCAEILAHYFPGTTIAR